MLCDVGDVDKALEGGQSEDFMKSLCGSCMLCASMFDTQCRDLTYTDFEQELNAKLESWKDSSRISDDMLTEYWTAAADLESKLAAQVGGKLLKRICKISMCSYLLSVEVAYGGAPFAPVVTELRFLNGTDPKDCFC